MNTILVAECGINHNGNIELAKTLIDMASQAKCKFVKFQKRTIEDVYTQEELSVYRESPWGKTFREQKEGLELKKKDYEEIDSFCKQKNIGWFASPWDIKSVDFLCNFDNEYIKVAAACITNKPLLERIKDSGKKIILSAGMCSKEELDSALSILGRNVEFLLSCTSTYPTNSCDMNMEKIRTLKKEYGTKYRIGFSNHSPSILFIIMAYTLGAEMIEFHITKERSMYGSDQSASIEFPGMVKIREYVQDMEISWGEGKIECSPNEIPIRKKLTKKWSNI